jgi:hypothetical protein
MIDLLIADKQLQLCKAQEKAKLLDSGKARINNLLDVAILTDQLKQLQLDKEYNVKY